LINELHKCDSFFFSVAFITNSGVAALINVLKELELKGIKGKIIASQYQNFTEPKALQRLTQFKNIELRIVTEGNFHAKGYIFKKDDTYSLIVGSSNLTQNALSMNKEWNLKVSSSDSGALIINTLQEFDYTFQGATIVDEAWIKEYNKIYDDILLKIQYSHQ
jgi:HKD family nuclease